MAEVEKEVTSQVTSPVEKQNEALNSVVDTQNSSSISYIDGKPIYLDPESKAEFEWDDRNNEWITRGMDTQVSGSPNYRLVDGTYLYKDEKNNISYKWNKEKNSWDVLKKEENSNDIHLSKEFIEEYDEDDEKRNQKEIRRQDMTKGKYGFENDNHTYTDSDGTIYIWDTEKNAWFPKVDEDFLARYQMSYGFTEPPVEADKPPVEADKPPVEDNKLPEKDDSDPQHQCPSTGQLKRKQDEPTWFEVDPENNTKVYVSNLPLDITETEFVDLMQKCGLIMKDPESGKLKIKLYAEHGSQNLKGDALCTYIKVESVELALKILDGYDVRGKIISVDRAKFTMKGTYDPTLKPRKRKRKEKERLKKQQEKLFDWRPDKMRGERSRHEKVVIIKNLFDSLTFEKDVGIILEYQEDLREECSKCGEVKKVIIYDGHPEGVAQINFKEAEAADSCIQLLNNRWFGQRKITAKAWDGKTRFKRQETESQEKGRIEGWESFLDSMGEKNIDVEVRKEDIINSTDRESDQETRSSAGSNDESDEN